MRAFRPDDLFHLRGIRDVALAPAGEEVVYTLSIPDPRADGYMRRICRLRVDRRETTMVTTGPADRSPRYSPDGQHLAFLRGVPGKAQLYLLTREGGEARQFTSLPGGVEEYSWSPDGRQIAVTAVVGPGGPTTARVASALPRDRAAAGIRRFDRRRIAADKTRQLFLFGLDGTWRQLTYDDEDVSDPVFSPGGGLIAYRAHRGSGVQSPRLSLVASGGGEARRIAAEVQCTGHPAFSPDGSYLACIGSARDEVGERRAVWGLPLDGGPAQRLGPCGDVPLVDGLGGETLRFHPDGRSLFLVVQGRGGSRLAEMRLEDGALTMVTPEGRVVEEFALALCAEGIAVVSSRPDAPAQLEVLDAAGRSMARNPDGPLPLGDVRFQCPERVRTHDGNGRELDVHVLRPPHAFGRLPVLLALAGGKPGPHLEAFSPTVQWLCARGFAVILPDLRPPAVGATPCPGSICGDWGEDDLAGVLAALETALAQFPDLDEGRIGVLGEEYGGYLAQLLLARTDRFRAGASLGGFSDLVSLVLTSDLGERYRATMPAAPWSEPSGYLERSPLAQAESVLAPLLLVHGEEDRRCPIGQAQEMFSALCALGRPVDLMRFPGEGHDLQDPQRPWHRVLLLEEIGAFFERYLAE